MPYRLTRLVMYLVGPIRMLEQEFLEMIPDSPPEPDDFIFVRRGIPLSRIYFTQILRNITAQYISIEIGSLDYIPVIKSMLAHMVNIQIDLDYDDAGPIDAAYQNSSPSLWKAMERASEDMFGDCLTLAARWWHTLQVEKNPSFSRCESTLKLSDALEKIMTPQQEHVVLKRSYPATPNSLHRTTQ